VQISPSIIKRPLHALQRNPESESTFSPLQRALIEDTITVPFKHMHQLLRRSTEFPPFAPPLSPSCISRLTSGVSRRRFSPPRARTGVELSPPTPLVPAYPPPPNPPSLGDYHPPSGNSSLHLHNSSDTFQAFRSSRSSAPHSSPVSGRSLGNLYNSLVAYRHGTLRFTEPVGTGVVLPPPQV